MTPLAFEDSVTRKQLELYYIMLKKIQSRQMQAQAIFIINTLAEALSKPST